MTSLEGTSVGGGDASAAAPDNNDPDSQHLSASTSSRKSSSSNVNNNNQPDDEPPQKSHRPADVALKQQRMKSWQPVLDPKWVIACYLMIGIIFIPTGVVIRNKSADLIEVKSIYESYLKDGTPADVTGCEIGDSPNSMWIEGGEQQPGKTCEIKMQVPLDQGDLEPPVLVHYELDNFYQNYRKYVNSYDQYQLLGRVEKQDKVSSDSCQPLSKIGDVTINPCGLIANTLFNDVIKLVKIEGPDGKEIENAPMVETGIAWTSDLQWKYKQPNGFKFAQCGKSDGDCSALAACDCTEVTSTDQGDLPWSCKNPYKDEDGNCFRYYYPNDESTQYLYETYPMLINPIEGVMNEHFVVWMRAAALPHFRKLYGYIERTVPAGSTLTFSVMANFAVKRLRGSKALVVSNSYIFGGKNHWLGTLFIAVGSIAAILGAFFLGKDRFAPRRLGDKMYLKYKEE
mmetsp:Transcript_45017/g.95797  ORF Transcript_45017/g.95797 Transcript_45017/m.95797 type:complete len:456 (-) Transcript_45017:264-1631(-)|eukprot:CAMPEP_0172535476 /NCGR_PEP_ID=MMETSP1067-20121228/7468_1 /TAXON_ID=265564 ORGANISM="Thalassiosira punctigera, Strain Tpunct2005C2" /NCGR_SAMPLE_ID=MMETSP1067 /ASSEMBLY_ACC=CAM_ASM_000444 /LENGTH=455 /DNA_ID=CAMNT_0013320409 /DNA_START=70 /DNA_END=1437 /DNA_ORIENTATION=+